MYVQSLALRNKLGDREEQQTNNQYCKHRKDK